MNTSAYDLAKLTAADLWVPACGGTEVPYTVNGRRYLYVYNFGRREHGWLDLETDLVQAEDPASRR